MTWWQVLIVFTIYGTGARTEVILRRESIVGIWGGLLINLPFTAAAWILVYVWGGITS